MWYQWCAHTTPSTQTNADALGENAWLVYFWHEPKLVPVWISEHGVLHVLSAERSTTLSLGFTGKSGVLDG